MTRSISGCGFVDSEDIVKKWSDDTAADKHVGLDTWRQLSPEIQDKFIEEEVERNGIEKPTGYTVSFHYNARVEAHHFGKMHPMKPWRLTLAKQLTLSYGLQYAMDLFESRMATKRELAEFHSEEYLTFLEGLNPRLPIDNKIRYKYLGDEATAVDCPIFDNMWDYFRLYSGASLDGARNLISDQSDIAINWSGGLHHAHKAKAAGFCYINDIVLAIQQLLLTNTRVLYIDIDVHHGDGVEEAFFSTDRVLTLSFHNYWAEFFPGTGSMTDIGPRDPVNPGAHHSLNVPLHPGISDQQWTSVFESTTAAVIASYDPSAIVLQCGADSLGGDRLGQFNVSIKAHGNCVDFVKRHCHNRKLLIVGGGGYTPRNVARCWTHETALCVGASLQNAIPAHVPYRQAFIGPEHGNGLLYPEFTAALHKNENAENYLQTIVFNIQQQLRYMQGAPSVQMAFIPDDYVRVRREEDARRREDAQAAERDEARRHMEERNLGVKNELRGP